MKDYSKKRVWMSRILLAVFVPMLLFSILHTHMETADVDCSECLSHVRHSHLATADFCIDHCVLCQFQTLPFLFAMLSAVIISPIVRHRRYIRTYLIIPVCTAGLIYLRAPPRM